MSTVDGQVSEWRAQLQGALDRRSGKAYVTGRPYHLPWPTQVRYTHGWLTLHQACDCRYSLDAGRSA